MKGGGSGEEGGRERRSGEGGMGGGGRGGAGRGAGRGGRGGGRRGELRRGGHGSERHPGDRQAGDAGRVVGRALEVRGEEHLHAGVAEYVIRGGKRFEPFGGQFDAQRRLIELHPFDAALPQFLQNPAVADHELWQQRQTVESSDMALRQPQVSERPNQHRLDRKV
ncbi:hypothetical protein A6V37_37195 [Paraburkholderia ginsengiterrae]|uniref:Uncharacterized protein n=1 Tax=Paraburkholderia ginsengiterrae TaxID=1462993 RepID=A0A1A9MVZ5_9BURK|nr:hypothetical protein A6V37_37195 [Paraburkholderia ginsengiterrae]